MNGSLATISDSTFLNLSAEQQGGAIYTGGADLTVTDTAFVGNDAWRGGGIAAVLLASNEAIVTNSSFQNSEASERGGGIYHGSMSGGGRFVLVNSTLSANEADIGGGIYNAGDMFMSIANATLYGNSANTAGGLYNGGDLQLINSIITVSTNDDCINSTFLPAAIFGYNNLVDDYLAGDCSSVSFDMVTNIDNILQLNGSANDTETHALLAGSNAIDTGMNNCPDPSAFNAPLTADQRQLSRPAGQICDIGAFEKQ